MSIVYIFFYIKKKGSILVYIKSWNESAIQKMIKTWEYWKCTYKRKHT